MKNEREAFPTLLNKSDAMMNAADYLERQIGNLRLINAMAGVFGKMSASDLGDKPDTKEALEGMKAAARGIVDVELQARAMAEAAKEIRAAANEMKLIEARSASTRYVEPAR